MRPTPGGEQSRGPAGLGSTPTLTCGQVTVSLLLLQLFIFGAVRMEAADFTQCATHGSFSRRWQETLYNMFHFLTLYVLPLLVMSCCYSRILLHIHLQHLRDKGNASWAHLPPCGQV